MNKSLISVQLPGTKNKKTSHKLFCLAKVQNVASVPLLKYLPFRVYLLHCFLSKTDGAVADEVA